jgi:hypothetical protein
VLSLGLTTRARVAETSVYVTTASVALAGGGTLFLDEAAHGWEVSAAGCRPTAPDLPYDCELQAIAGHPDSTRTRAATAILGSLWSASQNEPSHGSVVQQPITENHISPATISPT